MSNNDQGGMVSCFLKRGLNVVIGFEFASAAISHQEAPLSSMDHLTAEERRFLLHIGGAGLARLIREDGVLASLLDSGMIEAEQVDDETAILKLTPEGHTVTARFRDNMG